MGNWARNDERWSNQSYYKKGVFEEFVKFQRATILFNITLTLRLHTFFVLYCYKQLWVTGTTAATTLTNNKTNNKHINLIKPEKNSTQQYAAICSKVPAKTWTKPTISTRNHWNFMNKRPDKRVLEGTTTKSQRFQPANTKDRRPLKTGS